MAVPLKTENLSVRHDGKAAMPSRNGRNPDSRIQRFSNTDASSQFVDGLLGSQLKFGCETLANSTIDLQDFYRRECFGFEAKKTARIRHAGLPADGKVLTLKAIGATGKFGARGFSSTARRCVIHENSI